MEIIAEVPLSIRRKVGACIKQIKSNKDGLKGRNQSTDKLTQSGTQSGMSQER